MGGQLGEQRQHLLAGKGLGLLLVEPLQVRRGLAVTHQSHYGGGHFGVVFLKGADVELGFVHQVFQGLGVVLGTGEQMAQQAERRG